MTCDAIDPEPTDTGWMSEEQKEDTARVTPLGRIGVPQDCANPVTFLCSAEGGWINGRLLRSDGGLGGQATHPRTRERRNPGCDAPTGGTMDRRRIRRSGGTAC
ncbi:SDR family oxidoreductase [Streptomyces lavendulae]